MSNFGKYLVGMFLGLMLTSCLHAGDITSTTGVDGYVNRFYSIVLNRTADQGGFDYWTSSLNDKTRAGGDIAKGFFNSEEYTNRGLDNATFVDICYRAFFGREADAGGRADWLGQLNAGVDKQKVLDGFIYSQEFDNLVNAYGILAVMPAAPVETAVDISGKYLGTTNLTSGSLYDCEYQTAITLNVGADNTINGYTDTGITVDGLVVANNSTVNGTTSDGTVWSGTLNNGTFNGTYNWYNTCVGTFSASK